MRFRGIVPEKCHFPKGREAQREPVPFKDMLPLKLRGYVSGKGSKDTNACCLQEMAILFACLKNNEFSEALCSKEIQNFQKCYKDSLVARYQRKEQEKAGIIPYNTNKLNAKQLNRYLKKFPHE